MGGVTVRDVDVSAPTISIRAKTRVRCPMEEEVEETNTHWGLANST